MGNGKWYNVTQKGSNPNEKENDKKQIDNIDIFVCTFKNNDYNNTKVNWKW